MKRLRQVPLPMILLITAIVVAFAVMAIGTSGLLRPAPPTATPMPPTVTPTTTPSPPPTATPTATPTSTATPTPTPTATPTPTPLPLTLSSSAFSPGGEIPERFGYFREDISPPIAWANAPAGTQSLALTVEDATYAFTHWVVYNIPPTATQLAEGVIPQPQMADGMRQGLNSNEVLGYIGPFPPAGETHRYIWTLYALDTSLSLPPGATKAQLQQAMEGHILAKSELSGTYRGVQP